MAARAAGARARAPQPLSFAPAAHTARAVPSAAPLTPCPSRRAPPAQTRVALLVAVGFALGAIPVYLHSRQPAGVENPYAAAKQRTRDERFAWYQSDEMPSK